MFYAALPEIEAYRELHNRRTELPLSPQRMYDLTLLVTGDETKASEAYSSIKFAHTPI